LDGVLQLFKARVVNAGVLVEKQFKDETPLYVFAADLRQVFANFIGNALDASNAGGKLVLRLHRSVRWSDDSSGMRVVIVDTGHGMTEAVRRRIFEPFFTTKELTGTGLGLWVSLGILRNHGASIQVRSTTDAHRHGSVFSIFFPSPGCTPT